MHNATFMLFSLFWWALDSWNAFSRGSSRHAQFLLITYNVLVCLVAVRGAERPSVCKLGWQRPHFFWMWVSSCDTYNTKLQQPVLMVEVPVVQEEVQFTSYTIRSELLLKTGCNCRLIMWKMLLAVLYCIICSNCSM